MIFNHEDKPALLDDILQKERALLIYFSHEGCSVCKTLKPKVFNMANVNFPSLKTISIDAATFPIIAAGFSVFVSPVVLVFFENKEYIRKSRNFSMEELKDAIKRYYDMLFEDN